MAVKRIFRRHYSALDRRLRRAAAGLSPALVLLALEAFAVGLVLLFALTGARVGALDRYGARADAAAVVGAAALLAALHFFANRRVVPALDRRLTGRTYDERRILFDLGRAARGATNTDQLYELIVREIAGALVISHVSIFVRDERTGDFVCRVCSGQDAASRDVHSTVEGGAGQAGRGVLTRDSLVVRRLRNLSAPLGITPRDLDTWRRALASFDEETRGRRERECATLRDINARLLVGVTMQGRLLGILSLGARNGAREFTENDKRMLMSVANQLAFIIENAKLAERMAAEESLRRELAFAREVQQRLLPGTPPDLPGVTLSGFCQPARGIGGDYYDFLHLGEDQIGLAVADVAGKGIGAALLMSNVQASWRSQILAQGARDAGDGSLAELIRTMNRLVFQSTAASSYVTFFCARLDARTRVLSYVNAGHNPPLLVKAKGRRVEPLKATEPTTPILKTNHASLVSDVAVNGCAGGLHAEAAMAAAAERVAGGAGYFELDKFGFEELQTGGPVLGVFEELRYEQGAVRLEGGDLLVAYTDGLTEALDAAGEEFGVERLRVALAACAGLSADEVRDRVVAGVREWCAGAPQHDDLTFLVLKVN